MGSGTISNREGADEATTDGVAPLWGDGEESKGEQRVNPQREADHRHMEDEAGRESRVGSENVCTAGGIKGQKGGR